MDPQDKADSDSQTLAAEAPDFFEETFADEIDNIVPTRGYQMTPMVALGGSAGSVQALAHFFQAMPPNSGMVFVVILHLSPTHESSMADYLGRATTMPVVQAEDGQRAEPNHVYVIPPGKHLTTVNGHFRLVELKSEKGKRVAVDLFFRSLADTHGPHAAAVVLSGADGDGALGIKRIKERGGLTIAQDPEEADHAEMPRASINTGMVDWVLAVSEMPKRLLVYRDNEVRLKLPPEEGPPPAPALHTAVNDGEVAAPGCACLPAHQDRLRLFLLQARDHRAADCSSHAGQRRRERARLPDLPAHPSGRGGRAVARPADLGDEFLPRP